MLTSNNPKYRVSAVVSAFNSEKYIPGRLQNLIDQTLYQTTQLEIILSAIDTLPLEEPVDRQYARLRKYLEDRGTPIGPNDMLIAAHALALNCTVITANDREFSRVPGLKVENWLAV